MAGGSGFFGFQNPLVSGRSVGQSTFRVPGCGLRRQSSQTIKDVGVTDTNMEFDIQVFLSGIKHSTTNENTKVTIQKGGRYVIAFAILWPSGQSSAGTLRFAYVIRNGGTAGNALLMHSFAPTTGRFTQAATQVVNLNSGDYLQLQFQQDSGGDMTVEGQAGTPILSLTYIGAS